MATEMGRTDRSAHDLVALEAASIPGIDAMESADAAWDGVLLWSMPGLAELWLESVLEPQPASARVSAAVAAVAMSAGRDVRERLDMGVSFQVGAVMGRG